MATRQNSGCLGQLFNALRGAGSGASATETIALPYRTRSRFVSQNEALIYTMLERHDDQRVVFANVRLSDLIEVTTSRSDRSAWQTAFNRIGQRQVDFIVCDCVTYRPLLAIELDDATHDTARRAKSDALENQVFNAAGLPLLRLRGK
jgi:hypothetical protein